MPRQVDHEQRRRAIGRAALEVILRDGIDGCTVRAVAAQAGMALATLQHYAADREDMLLLGLQSRDRRRGRRVERAIASLPPDATTRQRLEALMLAVLPVDVESREDALAGAAFNGRALHHAPTREILSRGRSEVIGVLRAHLERARADGELAADAQPTLEAEILFSLLEPTSSLVGGRTGDVSRAMVEAHLDRLLPGG